MARTIVVGDVHGCFAELAALLELAAVRDEDLLVSVGDLVDRGPEPAEVIRLFRERPNSVVVTGNHERKHVRGIFSYAQEITRLQLGPGYGDAVGWMATLPYHFENAHVRVVHAALLPGVPLSGQPEELLCGSTAGERVLAGHFPQGHWHERYTGPKPVAFGHHVTGRAPLLRDGVVFGLDTGACHGWNLTAVSFPDRTVYSVPARADHWARIRREWQEPVLKTRPWLDMPWPELAAEASRHAGTPWVAGLSSWAAALRALEPALAAAARASAATLDPAAMRAHPAAPTLFQAASGRLDVARTCRTPRRTLALAEALGVATPEPPF
ncbi:metallophosphoesterase [Dactylosporangium sp. CA-233914]|uniref:metallophosphoesterase n=1 Tax=Dactylosporangium sp. CA-233914 TaxID=3239934 RepID=UPI003D91B585